MLVKDKAKLDAQDVLKGYWSAVRFPVDPERIARSMGIEVSRVVLSSEISGMLQVEPDVTPQIYVDWSDVDQRQRFTIAHEIGHYYERTSRGARDFNFIDRRGGEYDVHEFYADEFAANLLMPEDEVRRLHRGGHGIAEMAAHFGVSMPAMRMRSKRLNLR